MGRTYTQLDYHIVFATKYRQPWIWPSIENRVWDYLGGIARERGLRPYRIGGVEDHLHLALGIPPTISVSKALQWLKGGSSRWIHDTFPALRDFAWQDGYGAFTVSRSALPRVVRYIANQRVRHERQTFVAEYLELLARHELDCTDFPG